MKKGKFYTGIAGDVAYPNRTAVRVIESDDPEDIGRTVTVKNVIPGRKIRFLLNKNRRDNPSGICRETLAASPLETQEPCAHFGDCGGCLYQTVGYEKQLELKKRQVQKLLDGAVRTPFQFEGILASPEVEFYRNKMELPIEDMKRFLDGILHIYDEGRTKVSMGELFGIVTAAEDRLAEKNNSVAP